MELRTLWQSLGFARVLRTVTAAAAYVFGESRPKHQISFLVYAFLWLVACLGVLLFYFENLHTSALGVSAEDDVMGKLLILVFAFFTIIQQLLLYFDLHDIEKDSSRVATEYRSWLDRRAERVLRFFIMLTLLFGVGEVAHVFRPILAYFGSEEARKSFDGFLHSHLFVMGSVLVYVLLVLWNGLALMFRWRSRPGSYPDNRAEANDFVAWMRILFFVALSAICFVYWLFVYVKYDHLSDWAKVLIMAYVLCVSVVFLLRYDKTRRKAVEWKIAYNERLQAIRKT